MLCCYLEEIMCINHESAMAPYWEDAGAQCTFWEKRKGMKNMQRESSLKMKLLYLQRHLYNIIIWYIWKSFQLFKAAWLYFDSLLLITECVSLMEHGAVPPWTPTYYFTFYGLQSRYINLAAGEKNRSIVMMQKMEYKCMRGRRRRRKMEKMEMQKEKS